MMIPIYNGFLNVFPLDSHAVYDNDGNRYLTFRDPMVERMIVMRILLSER